MSLKLAYESLAVLTDKGQKLCPSTSHGLSICLQEKDGWYAGLPEDLQPKGP